MKIGGFCYITMSFFQNLPRDLQNKIFTYSITNYPFLKEIEYRVTRDVYTSLIQYGTEEYRSLWYSLSIENRQKLLKFDLRQDIDLLYINGVSRDLEYYGVLFVNDITEFLMSLLNNSMGNVTYFTIDDTKFLKINSRIYPLVFIQ